MEYKFKSLVKKFSYNAIIAECDRQGWRLPTLAEVRGQVFEHSMFWVADNGEGTEDMEHRLYNSDNPNIEYVANKDFMFHVVVIAKDKVCSNCVHLGSHGLCNIYDFDIRITMGVPSSSFGCTTNFKLKR